MPRLGTKSAQGGKNSISELTFQQRRLELFYRCCFMAAADVRKI